MLDAACEHDVARTERDLARSCRDGGQRAGAHAVEREAGDRLWDAGEQRNVAAECQSLVADLRCRREDHVTDAFGRNLGIAAEQLAHDLDGHVVSARLPKDSLRAGATERRAHAVDEHDLPTFHVLRVYVDASSCSRRSSSCQQSAASGSRWNWISTVPPGETSLPSRHTFNSRRYGSSPSPGAYTASAGERYGDADGLAFDPLECGIDQALGRGPWREDPPGSSQEVEIVERGFHKLRPWRTGVPTHGGRKNATGTGRPDYRRTAIRMRASAS